jgi:hypothetical protein
VNLAELALYYNKLASNFTANYLAFGERHFLVSCLGFVLTRFIRLSCPKYIIGVICVKTLIKQNENYFLLNEPQMSSRLLLIRRIRLALHSKHQ